MYLLELNSGSRAIPKSPLSPMLSTFKLIKGSAKTEPFLITLTTPPFSRTKILLSGKKAKSVGILKPWAIFVLVKLEGNAYALSEKKGKVKKESRIKRNKLKKLFSIFFIVIFYKTYEAVLYAYSICLCKDIAH